MSPRAPVRSANANGTARSPISAGREPSLLSVTVQSSASSRSVNVSLTCRSCGGASTGSGPTRHSATAGGGPCGASVTSILSAIVFTGSNSTVVNAFTSRPYPPFAATSFHAPSCWYSSRHDCGATVQNTSVLPMVSSVGNVYWTHCVAPAVPGAVEGRGGVHVKTGTSGGRPAAPGPPAPSPVEGPPRPPAAARGTTPSLSPRMPATPWTALPDAFDASVGWGVASV